MGNSQYDELDKLIKEYEEDFRTIKSDRLIMKNYPKVLTMSAASLFEYQIKNRCQEFLDSPILPLNSYPNISVLKSKKPKTDQMFTKLEGYDDDDGIEHLCAEKFYNLFGGQAFKIKVESNFSAERSAFLLNVTTKLSGLSSLVGQGEQYDFDYAKQCDLKDMIERCSFDDAEKSYLSLKLRRNRVAHDYIHGLSDTFEDIQKFYYLAVIYVVALEATIKDLTVPIT